MKLAKKLFNKIDSKILQGNLDFDINDIKYDSRKVEKNDVFICISGTKLDAHTFIPKAIEKGASVIVVEKNLDDISELINKDVTIVQVDNTRKALAYISCEYFDHPANDLTTIGITGTKGKTTTTYMLQSMLENANKKVGVIGTIGIVINGEYETSSNTTPESYELQHTLRRMVDNNCEYCIMEASSQGIKMHRVDGFTYDIALFTNFSKDHIGAGEHETIEEYLYYKSLIFQKCKIGIINKDDKVYEKAIESATCDIKTFAVENTADLVASDIEYINDHRSLGMEYTAKGILNDRFFISIPGRFSVYNALGASFIAHLLNIETKYIKETLADVRVRGRVESIPINKNFSIMIDYAHNAASVESLLTTLKEYKPNRIVCVYGAGGDRSKERRYDMGELCGKMADLSILTMDNPRSEEVIDICKDIQIGLSKTNGKSIIIEDREEALIYAMDNAEDGDFIVTFGKGHETYQEHKGVRTHFSEIEIIEKYKLKNNI